MTFGYKSLAGQGRSQTLCEITQRLFSELILSATYVVPLTEMRALCATEFRTGHGIDHVWCLTLPPDLSKVICGTELGCLHMNLATYFTFGGGDLGLWNQNVSLIFI